MRILRLLQFLESVVDEAEANLVAAALLEMNQ